MQGRPSFNLSIRAKLIVALLILASVPLSIGGTYGVFYSIRTLEDATLHHLEYEVSSKSSDIEKFLKGLHNDAIYLSQSRGINLLVDYKGKPDSIEFENLKKRVKDEFLAFSATRPYYFQIRYINKKGYEVVRIDSDGKTSFAVPDERLQFKGDRYYFIDAMKYEKGQCYVSPMDLNIEWGKVEIPHRPVVRVATPVFDIKGEKLGVVIINIFANYLIQQMQMINIAKGGATSLVNNEGFYLTKLNSQTKDSSFAVGTTERFDKDYSKDIVAKILSGRVGTIKDISKIISYAPITTGDSLSKNYWILVLEYPKSQIFASISRLRIVYFAIGIVSIMASIAIGLLVARRLTNPILKLYEGVEWIAGGDFEHKLDIKTGDEIEGLAKRFNSMSDRLKESRERILKWNEELKREVENRTRELEISHNELLVERNKLESVLMCASEGIIVADENDIVIMMNPAAEAMLNVQESVMLGKSIFPCHKHPDNVVKMLKDIQKTPVSITADIGRNIIDISIASINIGDKRIGSMMVMRDVTERHRFLETQQQMERQLAQADKMASIGELSTGIAHEIGNPLASIKTVIQAMEDDCPLKGQQKKYLSRILQEVNRLTAFLRTFSAFAQPSAKQSANCQIDAVLKDVLFLIQKEAVKHGITIYEEVKKDLPKIKIDPHQMQQIFINLLLNAIQAMPDGGIIKIIVGCGEKPADRDIVEISISDTGCGIPLDQIDKIFNPFFTTKPMGTGLGLSIIHRIINECGGKITVDSRVGSGTAFTILLPADTFKEPTSLSFQYPINKSNTNEIINGTFSRHSCESRNPEIIDKTGFPPTRE